MSSLPRGFNEAPGPPNVKGLMALVWWYLGFIGGSLGGPGRVSVLGTVTMIWGRYLIFGYWDL